MESWKPVVWYEWLYGVSNIGRVKSLRYWKERIMKHWISKGYMFLNLRKDWNSKSFLLHRLVAISFISNPENKLCVNHKNGIKTDNTVENLEWCTHSENTQHAFKTWLSKISENHNFYTNHPSKWKFWKDNNLSKTVLQFTTEWLLIKEWCNAREITKELNINYKNISNCCRWKSKTSSGFVWKFKELL